MPKFNSIISTIFHSEKFTSRYYYFYLLYTCIRSLCHRFNKVSWSFSLIFLLSGCLSKQILPPSNFNQNPVDQNISYPLQISSLPTKTITSSDTPNVANHSFSTFMIIIGIVISFCFFPYILIFLRHLFYRIKNLTKTNS
jgi:beta-lactamase regulating signal transducer with metallopeptidase domain